MEAGIIILIGALSLLLILLFCSHTVREGYVVEKRHYETHAIAKYDRFLRREAMRYTPDRYFIYLSDCRRVEEIEVTKEVFDSLVEGQKWHR